MYDTIQTRQLHDGGAKHKFNVDEFHKKKRNEKLFGARSEGEIKQQLAEIERAAKEAVAADRLEENGLFYSVSCNLSSIVTFALDNQLQRKFNYLIFVMFES